MSDEKAAKALVDSRAKEVDSLIASGSSLDAVKKAVADLPPKTKDGDVKKKAADTVFTALNAVDQAKIAKLVDDLDDEQQSTIMKYVFKCMSTADNCANLLKWHEALVAKGGTGVVMRALVDRSV
eukprot:TRINITY_DN1028_c0_g1_i11.p1 TRINITY_DN1028_c0_g1~~TRINITY_DN1028_c0_g1_i11.p1  ORF type:complete len:125 (+),score=22.17 TRINITY_DN1028_c0_g1_i11:87-461(+)